MKYLKLQDKSEEARKYSSFEEGPKRAGFKKCPGRWIV